MKFSRTPVHKDLRSPKYKIRTERSKMTYTRKEKHKGKQNDHR